MRRLRKLASLAACAIAVSLVQAPAFADELPPKKAEGWAPSAGTTAPAHPSAVPEASRRALLGPDYQESTDRIWTSSGDATGFHVLTAAEKDGYRWKTAATLTEPGFDTDTWIGNVCVTASGRHAAVAYAPRTFTNKPDLMTRGAFTAVVDLTTGKVTKLPFQATLGYFSPGCGTAEDAVFSQFTDDDSERNETRLIRVDGTRGTADAPLTLRGQVTSAVPVGEKVVAARGSSLVEVADGGTARTVAETTAVPFQLMPDADGGVVFLDQEGTQDRGTVRRVSAEQLAAGKAGDVPTALASGELTALDLARSASGTVFVTGKATTRGPLPRTVRYIEGLAKNVTVSSLATAAVTSRWADGKDSRIDPSEALSARTVRAHVRLLETGRSVTLDVPPADELVGDGKGTGLSPSLPQPSSAKMTRTAAASPVEADRSCSVPRGDSRKQAFQPTPRQVEWAVDQAVTGNLNKHISRPADWKGTGMAAYQPQTLFPLKRMEGDPGNNADWHVPAQVMLGITAQESNMWQATRYAVPGVTANPLIGNYYGVGYEADGEQKDPWKINFAKADCGYGITQVTDGMRVHGKEKPDESPLTTVQQEAVALDYTANIAAGVNILVEKWNQTRKAGMIVNGGTPKFIENWTFALWAYNAGFYEESEKDKHGGHWGVGFTNNPANPLWKANRTPFLENSEGKDDYSHAAHPQDWPYQEKVIGWAARPISAMFAPGDMQPGYRAAWWNSNTLRTGAKPGNHLFCDSSNKCNPSKIGDNDSNDPGRGACELDDPKSTVWLHCWWNKAVKWKDCDTAAQCGNAVHRFNATYPEQPDGNAYPPRCDAEIPSGTYIVDNLPDGIRPAGSDTRSCGTISSAGSFDFDFASPSARMDLHQIGAAYRNHFWFTHTRMSSTTDAGRLGITGTWSLNYSMSDWVRVMVHLPDHGAHTQQAKYEIDTGNGKFTRTRFIGQEHGSNTWVSLGAYQVSGKPRVRLSNLTLDGTGDDDVAWDAVAFQPLGEKPHHMVAVLGDSYTSGEGAGNYSPESDKDHGTAQWNACRRSDNAWARKLVLPGMTKPVGAETDSWGYDAELGFVACSGAMTKNVGPVLSGNSPQRHKEGQFNEVLQTDSGVLSSDTTLVMLTLGGNDEAGFANAMTECGSLTNCASDDFLTRKKQIVDRMIPDLRSVLEETARKADNAQIVLMGYPELLSRTVKCTGSWYYDMSEVQVLAELVNYANAEQKKLVDSLRTGPTKIKVQYADPVGAFVGHSGCDDPEWINKIVIGPNGDGDFHDGDPAAQPASCLWGNSGGRCLSRESFHPKNAGTTGYAEVMRKRLGEIGYTGS
ncbi:GDSL-type esterase/lipase family protein [Streptomyces niveiscabiei]|uniref:golvesin C-terminal-like domain-containing protein n=1 Tax=Streptomyces niveiscabiei TaxID=164115 RepID=UPI0007C82366|nr:GDSL-type esterase/lipase family protein [Streptomyces niveiscabiei]